MTSPNPTVQREAAALLRDAAQVIGTKGHTRQTYVDNKTGNVCMEGALRVASAGYHFFTLDGKKRQHLTHGEHFRTPAFEQAIKALIPLLPDRCTVHANPSDCGHCDTDMSLDPQESRIHHYNDFVCEGGSDASLLLTQAAEKIEGNLP